MDSQTPDNTVAPVNPYAASSAELLEPVNTDTQELASRGSRFLATLIDGLISALVPLVVLMIFSFSALANLGSMADFSNNPVAVVGAFGVGGTLALISLIAIWVVQLVLISRYAATIGKRIMGIKVVRFTTGENCGLGRYFWLRGVVVALIGMIPFFIGTIFSILDPLFIFADDRRCLHDKIADTKVVKA